MRGLTVGAVLACAALAVACSSPSTAAPAPPPPPPLSAAPPSTSPSAPAAQVVDCGGNVLAERTAAGLVDCAEAVAVITEYRAVEEGDEPIAVRGWTCGADGDTEIVVCEKAGLSFHTGQ